MHILSDTSLDCSVDSDSRANQEHKKTFCLLPLSYLGKSSYIYFGFTQYNIKLKNKML